MFSNKGKIEDDLKRFSIFILVIGGVIGLVIGVFLSDLLNESGIWLLSAIIGVGIAQIPAMFIYGFGEIIALLRIQNGKMDEVYKQIQKNTADEKTKVDVPKPQFIVPKANRVSSNGWTCKKCGEKNEKNEQFCRNCGEYK